jgi:hypothetical protein
MSQSIDKTALSCTVISADAKEKGNPMNVESRITDIEDRLARIESEARRTKMVTSLAVWGILGIVLSLEAYRLEDSETRMVLVVGVVATWGWVLVRLVWALWWLIWGRPAEEARLREKIRIDCIAEQARAERAKTQSQDHS